MKRREFICGPGRRGRVVGHGAGAAADEWLISGYGALVLAYQGRS
jgi:hypothetical protein